MNNDAETEEARALMRAKLAGGVRATPLCLAIMGWICDAPTEPCVMEIKLPADGRVWLRLSGEAEAEPLCTFLDFLAQVRIVCQSLPMTETQTDRIVSWAQRRLF